MMKKVLALIFALTFSFTVFSSAYAADTNGGNDTNNGNDIAADTATNDDGDMDWGWIGLLGLAGLMGLRRRDDRRD